jgi:LacI family transcriptional regulator
MADIREVAKLANVSPSTVSRVLGGKVPVAGETKTKVLAAIAKLNYRPNIVAQSLKGGRFRSIGLLIPNVRSLVFPAAIRGIEDVAMKHGYIVVLCNTDEDKEQEKAYIEGLRSRLVDGFIFSTARPDYQNIKALEEEEFPVVLLIRQMGADANAVVVDNFSGAYQATQYLIGRGLKQIGLINGSLDIQLYQERFAGYQQAMKEGGLPLPDGAVLHDVYGWEDAYQVTMQMLNDGIRVDAFFATNDPKAAGAMRAIKDFGLSIPRDISVMGFDDIDIAPLLDPPLTTVAQPFYKMGARACEQLIKVIEGKRRSKPKIDVFPAKLVIRGSVI